MFKIRKELKLDIPSKVAIGGVVLAGLVIFLATRTMKKIHEEVISKTG